MDWVSINMYFAAEEDEPPVSSFLEHFDKFMTENVRAVAPDMPVLITELGFCDENVPAEITGGLNHFLTNYPEINGFVLWGDSEMSCLVTPGPEGDAFRAVIEANPSMFHSCVTFSDGTTLPGCS